MTKTDPKELYAAAKKARDNSHSPYSKYAVGAAVRTRSGKVYSGCNVENASYSVGVCAERVAILKAVSEEGRIEIAEVMVVTQSSPPAAPCGICRQAIAEFGMNCTVHVSNLSGESKSFSFKQLFPEAFTPDQLG